MWNPEKVNSEPGRRMAVTMLGGWGKRGDVFKGYRLPAVWHMSSVDLK